MRRILLIALLMGVGFASSPASATDGPPIDQPPLDRGEEVCLPEAAESCPPKECGTKTCPPGCLDPNDDLPCIWEAPDIGDPVTEEREDPLPAPAPTPVVAPPTYNG